MKVCMISYSQYEYDNRVHRYGASLLEHGDCVDVICLGRKGQPARTVIQGVRVIRIQTRDYNEKGPVSYLLRICAFFVRSFMMCTILHFRHRYHVMHFHNIPDFGVFCTLIPRLMGVKVILDVHDLVPEFYQRKFGLDENHPIVRILKCMEKWSCRFADHVITVTTLWEDTLTGRSVSAEKCSVILNSPDLNLFNRGYKRKDPGVKPFRLVYHGNLTEIFGVDLAIRAVAIIRQEIPDVEFQIYGQGKTGKSLALLIEELNLEKHVFLNTSVSRFSVPFVLGRADIGIDPKRDGVLAGEGLSSKCMEYLAIGLPAVVSGIKAARTYYDETMVRFFRPGDKKDLAMAVIELYKNPQMRKALVEGSAMFKIRHGWHIYQDIYFNMLDNLVKGRIVQ